jgi:hypothetical protein
VGAESVVPIWLRHRSLVFLWFACAVLVSGGFWLGRPYPAFAAPDSVASPCAIGESGEGGFAPGETSESLERAWNASDPQTLAMFADDARLLTAWGHVWEGKSQASSFLHAFFYDQTRPLQTLAQCEDGDTVIWTFRYPSGVKSAMIVTVRNARIEKLYWLFLPEDFKIVRSDSSDPSDSSSSGSGPVVSAAAVQAGAIAVAIAALMYLVILSDGSKQPSRVTGELISALRARRELEPPDAS